MQNYTYPSSSDVTITGTPNGAPIPTTSILVASENTSGDQTPLQSDINGALIVSPLTTASVVTANQGAPNTLANAWPVQLTDGTNINSFTANGLKVDGSAVTQPISAVSLPLPTGASTSALQTTANGLLSDISAQLPATLGQTTSAASLAVVIASDQSTIPVSLGSVPLPTGAATSANQTDGSQKTQIVDGSGNVIGSTSNALNVQIENASIAITAASLPLPTGAATSANQATEITSLATIATNTGNIPTNGQKTMAASLPVVIASDQSPLSVSITPGTVIGNAPIQNVYSSTNITTSAYVQLVASTSNTINTVHIFDSSGQAMIFAIGAMGSEVDQLYVPPGGDTYALHIPAGSRVAYKALSANATSGYLLMSFLE